jgi:hypothetical protein
MADQLRAVCVQQISSAWSCLIGLEGYGYDLPVSLFLESRDVAHWQPFKELMTLSSTREGWLNPLEIARLDPPREHCGSMLALTKRLPNTPMSAPHWSHVFTTLLGAYVIMVTEGETTSPGLQPLRSPFQVWEMLKKWLVPYIDQPDEKIAGGRIRHAAQIVSDCLDCIEAVIEARNETRQGWFSGKAFTDLLDFWIDLSRKVSSLVLAMLTQ